MTNLYISKPTLPTRLSADVCIEVAHLLAETLRTEPPGSRVWAMPADRQNLPLGGYLLGHGYIRPSQLVQALAIQRQRTPGEQHMLLGDILVARGTISPRVLATMLAVQLVDRLIDPAPFTPARIGELLVAHGHIQPQQLARVIQLQSWLRLKGIPVRLGELLVQQNLVRARHIEEALSRAEAM